jgi:long-chain fatty acid transport protein
MHACRVALAALAVALATLAAAPAQAGGFYVPEIGPRAAAMGGALSADDQDASSSFHNPAGLAGLWGSSQVQAASGVFVPDVTFFRRPVVDPGTGQTLRFSGASNTNHMIVAPYVGGAWSTGVRGLELGFGVYAPFGATLDFPDNGAQRQVLTGVALRTIYVGPSVGYALPGGLRVGLSLDYVYADLTLDQKNAIPYVTGDPEQFPDPDPSLEGTTHIQGKDPASFSATLGAQWVSPDARVVVGASVMTPTTLALSGDATVVNAGITALTDASGAELQPEGRRVDSVKMQIPLPLVARAGVRVRPTARTSIALDVNWQRWSTFRTLVVDFQHEYALLPTPGAYLYDVTVENHWRDTFSVRLGGETRLRRWPLALRGGLVYDQSPVDDRHFALLTPDSDKLGVGGGVGWTTALGGGRALAVDVSYLHLFVHERDVAPDANGMPGSDGTVLNKPAPSFYQGVTRAAFDVVVVALTVRL